MKIGQRLQWCSQGGGESDIANIKFEFVEEVYALNCFEMAVVLNNNGSSSFYVIVSVISWSKLKTCTYVYVCNNIIEYEFERYIVSPFKMADICFY